MPITDSVPGLQTGSTARNVIVAAIYLFLLPFMIALLPVTIGLIVGMNVGGAADKLKRLPGVGTGGGAVAGVVAGVYALLLLGLLGAVLPSDDTASAPEQSIENAGTMTSVTDGESQSGTSMSTETATPEPTPTATSEPTATPTPTPEPTPTATPTPTPTATPTATPEPSDDVTVRIIYDGEWSGAVGTAGSTRSVDGSGDTEIDIEDGDATVVSANAQKQDDSSDQLTVQILIGGEVVEETSTSAEYGVAQTSWSSF